uniref:HTH_48 domain-containing protein n=1 Tax=Caenorhabditis tropicalis TaxID=1561998 RepID=A0A1I7U0Y3_9PELO
MTNLKRKVHVERLELIFNNLEEFNIILNQIKIGPLFKLRLNGPELVFHSNQVPSLQAHFSHLTAYSSLSSVLDAPPEYFAHLEYLFVRLNAVDVEELKTYKNKMQYHRPRHCFYVNEEFDRNNLAIALQPDVSMIDFEDDGNITGRWRPPGSTTHQIEFVISTIGSGRIDFREIRDSRLQIRRNLNL